jgi:putative SbcD/Mre11-related phosphoesterase
MSITKIERFEAIDRCLFWREKKTLIVGDLHLGFEGYARERGMSFPSVQIEETLELFGKIFAETGKVKEIVLLGDVKHHLGGVLYGEIADTEKVFTLLKENLLKGGKIIVTKGDHDNLLEPIISGYDYVEMAPSYTVGDVLFFHGNERRFNELDSKIGDDSIKVVVIGDVHPAITLKEDAKSEKYKCFLYGKMRSKRKELIIVPSFFPLVEGLDVLASRIELSAVADIGKFEVFAVADKVYDMGRVDELGKRE